MADVLLREYVQELRAHVHARRLSDAFALGQHILRYYPKHIETYGILAQASLEADDLAGATDLFRRVLSADPENVLALAGMALLNETQDRNDEALWYLERAYEIQPTNDELRRELVRLRQEYYGATNERLELTPGALARIYARQGQYAAAVNEFRRLLRHESQRYDARVALAEILYRAGRVDEAAQLAQNIMRDAPYSLKPNLILGALWSDNAVPEGQEYLARAQALDPEYRVARDLVGARFAEMPAPRLPVIQEEGSAARAMAYSEPAAPTFEPTTETFESETEPIIVPDDIEERLRATELAEQQAQKERELSLAAAAAVGALAAAAIVELPSQETATPPTTETPTETPDATLAEIAAAEQQHAATPTPTPVETVPPPAPRARSKADSIPTDAIATAAAALATSIAVDKLKQPAPARRTHPALPKVRPVISGASEKLPAWLRLSATPAQAPAAFDAPAPTQAERIEPIVTPETPDTRPDWLVAAQAPTPDALPAAQDTNLPDWLVTAAVIRPPQESVASPAASEISPTTETVAPIAPELPEWLCEPGQTQTDAPIGEMPPPTMEATASRGLDDVSRETERIAPPEIVAPASEASAPQDAVMETEPTITQPPQADLPVWLTETKIPAPAPETTAASIETRASAESETGAPAEKPLDARALIQAARAKRDGGDIKGALDSYERAMHRRPNYLDEIIGDLQTLMQQPDTPGAAHRLLGEAYAMAGRYKESLEQYRLAMRK